MKRNYKETVFYEIYPNSFKDSNGDGYGDLQGIISKLDYIASLGFSGIWLNPIYDSPFFDGGYDIRDFFKVSERFGTEEDLKQLIEECHKRDIRLFLDLVPGHASFENKEFLESAKPERNEYSDLFIWNDNVWANEPGYRLISGLFQRFGCYMVNFFSHQPAINYGFNKVEYPWQHKVGSPEANKGKEFIESVMDYWLNLGVDGFRVDMADSLVKNDGNDKVETIKLWKSIRADLATKHPNFEMVSEWANPAQSLEAGFDSDFVLDHRGTCSHLLFRLDEYDSEAHTPLLMKYDEEVYNKFKTDLLKRLSEAKKLNKSLSFISGNHDTLRIANYLDDLTLRQAYVFLLTMPGVPFIYAGDEIGTHSKPIPSVEGGFQRTGTRMPMRFDSTKNAGFSTANKTFLPTNEDDSTVEEMEKDPTSLLHFIQKLIEIRNKESVLTSDEFELLDGNVLSYRRGNITVYINITNDIQTIQSEEKEILIASGSFKQDGGKIALSPKSSIVIK